MVSEPLRYLDAADVRAVLLEGAAHPRVEICGDRTILSARFRCIFPLSEPERYVSVQDAEGKEIGILKDLDELEPATRKIVLESLDRRYYTPPIQRVYSLRKDAGMWRFHVQTARGDISFFVRNWRDNAHEVQPDRWMITSVDGQRYEIHDVEQLDARSRSLLDQLA